MQERSLHFGRDDGTRIALSKHSRCTLRGIDPFPHTVISSVVRNLPCTPSFLAPFAKGFPFSAIPHRALYQCARKIEGFARDDISEATKVEYLSLIPNPQLLVPSHQSPVTSHCFPTAKKPQHKLELFRRRFASYLPNCASMVPAATAVPITPATFGPIACISR